MGGLDKLDHFSGETPPRRIWHEMLKEVRRRIPRLNVGGGREAAEFQHPWKVTMSRWEDAPPAEDARHVWRADVASACVNDEIVSLLYRRENDERGWKPPAGYPLPNPGDAGYSPVLLDRPMYEAEEPPFLVLRAPKAGQAAAEMEHFLPVSDAVRPQWFRTEEMWEKQLFRASIFTTADPGIAQQYLPLTPPRLTRFRLYAGKLPKRATAEIGGYVEVARVYLTREADLDPENDEMHVQQLVFWNLQAMIVQPGKGLFELAELFRGPGGDDLTVLLGNLEAGGLEGTLSGTAVFRWWTG